MEIVIFHCPYCGEPVFKNPVTGFVLNLPNPFARVIKQELYHACYQIEADRAFLERCALLEYTK